MTDYLKTEFGIARIDRNDYYTIKTSKEGNANKRLHRLIYEKHYGFNIPVGYHIHHKDGNKLNNNIDNLELLNESEHKSLHMKNNKYGLNNMNRFNPIIKINKRLSNRYKQGFIYRCFVYLDKNNKKQLSSTNINKLKNKIKKFILSDNNIYCYIGFEYDDELRIIKGVD